MEKSSAFVQEISTECKINAPPEKVYAVLSDFAHYADWTDEMTISGDSKPGGKLCVKVKTANDGKDWFTLSSKTRYNDIHMIAFDNVMGAPFLFFGRQCFELIPLAGNQTMLINAETFSGLTVPFVRKDLLSTTRRFKENMNLALKRAVETANPAEKTSVKRG